MQRSFPPFLFTIALYLVVLKDALRVVEFKAELAFPLSAPTAVILVMLVGYNVHRIAAQYEWNGLALSWITFILAVFTGVSLHLVPNELITIRDFFGIALVQLIIPLAALSSAMAYDLVAYFERSVHISIIILLVIISSLVEILFIMVDKTAAANLLLGLYKAGLIAYPLQTAAGTFSVRAPGLFYSAFALALFCTWVVALGIFHPRRSMWWLTLAALAIVVIAYTINRNGIIMCGTILLLRVVYGGKDRVNKWKIGLGGAMAVAFIVLVPIVSLTLNISTTDDSAFGKTSTMVTRANTWSDLLENQWLDLGLGTGSVQGVSIEGREEIVIDNFFLYIAYQDGILFALIAAGLCFATFWNLFRSYRGSPWIRLYTALFIASVVGFALNILFFEPIYQFLFLAPIVSLIATLNHRNNDIDLAESIATMSGLAAAVAEPRQ